VGETPAFTTPTPFPSRAKWLGRSKRVARCGHRPPLPDGVIHFISTDNYVYALDSRTGALKWKIGYKTLALDSLSGVFYGVNF
jgi:outer membrane protein assembly factor BamB